MACFTCAPGFTLNELTQKCEYDFAFAGVQDFSGNERHGTILGTQPPAIVPSPFLTGNAIEFTAAGGITEYVNFGDVFGLSASGLTIDFGLYKNDNTASGSIIKKGTTGQQYQIEITGAGVNVTVGAFDFGIFFINAGSPLLATPYRCRLIMDFANNTMAFYVDGVRSGSNITVIYGGTSIGNGDFILGKNDTSTNGLDGIIDNLRIFEGLANDPNDTSYVLDAEPYDNTGDPAGNYYFDSAFVNAIEYSCENCYTSVIPAIGDDCDPEYTRVEGDGIPYCAIECVDPPIIPADPPTICPTSPQVVISEDRYSGLLECCDMPMPTELQQKVAAYYREVHNITFDLLKTVEAKEAFGKKAEAKFIYDTINDFNYFLALLIIIYYERKEDADLNEPDHTDKGKDFYIEENKILCIRAYFQCKKINIDKLLDIFDLNPNTESTHFLENQWI